MNGIKFFKAMLPVLLVVLRMMGAAVEASEFGVATMPPTRERDNEVILETL